MDQNMHQDTFYVGTLKGVGRVYQQTYVDTYAKVAQCKLYTTKTPITAADMLNDRVLPFYEAHDLPVLRILTDRGTEYCGRAETHDKAMLWLISKMMGIGATKLSEILCCMSEFRRKPAIHGYCCKTTY